MVLSWWYISQPARKMSEFSRRSLRSRRNETSTAACPDSGARVGEVEVGIAHPHLTRYSTPFQAGPVLCRCTSPLRGATPCLCRARRRRARARPTLRQDRPSPAKQRHCPASPSQANAAPCPTKPSHRPAALRHSTPSHRPAALRLAKLGQATALPCVGRPFCLDAALSSA